MDKILGHYKLLGAIGHGGMSTVYEAIDQRMERRVAVKVIACPPSSSDEERLAMRSRQLREARVIAALSHPNIVTIHDMGVEGDHHYLVMERLEGMTLRARMNAGAIPLEEITAILDQAASALDAVHSQGIVHRDLKPSNIMLLPDGRVKLMDFGVARHPDDTMVTMAGMIVGSPTYMAPEQVRSEQSTAASDIWGLGVLLYEMIAGQPPFPGRNIPAILHQVAYDEAPPIEGASPQIQAVIDRVLQKDPDKRYGSAGELARAFKSALEAPSANAAAAAPITAAVTLAPRLDRSSPVQSPKIEGQSVSHFGDGSVRQSRLAALGGLAVVTMLVSFAAFRINQNSQPTPSVNPPAQVAARQASPPVVTTAIPVPAIHPSATARHRKHVAKPLAALQSQKAPEPDKTTATKPVPDTQLASSEPVLDPESKQKPIEKRRAVAKPRRSAQPTPPTKVAAAAPDEDVSVNDKVAEADRSLQSNAADGDAPDQPRSSMLGEWTGKIWRNPATLSVTRHSGNSFGGTISIDTPEGHVLVGVTGHVSPRTGAVTLQENRIIHSDKPRAWDLGTYQGTAGDGNIGGTGSDVRGRSYPWSFHR